MIDWLRVAKALGMLSQCRLRTRIQRCLTKLLSPQRLLATLAATSFLVLYIANGILIVLTRQAADPGALRLWLGGAMASYGVFHFLRAAWQDEPAPRLGLSSAEAQWIARAPISDRSLALYRIASIVPSTFFKTVLVATVMCCDVVSLTRLMIALFLAMTVLESVRMIADQISAALSIRGRRGMRVAMTAITFALCAQLIARTVMTAAGSLHPLALLSAFSQALGETASAATIQYLALPWQPMACFALAADWSGMALVHLMLSMCVVGGSLWAVIAVGRWADRHQNWVEGRRLSELRFGTHLQSGRRPLAAKRRKWLVELPRIGGVGPLMSRQWVGVKRYRATIAVSLAVPAALSLSPLMTSASAGLLHVAAWLAVSTLLLAPPALRIDFRRDIERMWLLKSLPISPLSMTLGQLILPSMITILFQLLVVGIACAIAPSDCTTVALVIGCLSGFAVFSFALENTLFLTFPHRIKQEGLAMMVRAKLVFLGKGLLLALLGGAFMASISLGEQFECSIVLLVALCVTASWLAAVAAVAMTARCWRRFDIRLDSPSGL